MFSWFEGNSKKKYFFFTRKKALPEKILFSIKKVLNQNFMEQLVTSIFDFRNAVVYFRSSSGNITTRH